MPQTQTHPVDPGFGPTDNELRLQALNHTKDRLLSIVSHDLRSAIAGVLSLAKLQAQRLEAGELEEARRLNGLIRHSTANADDLIRDLVNWMRSHGQEIHFRLEPLDVCELVEVEVERLRPQAAQKDQSLRIQMEDTGILKGDRYMLQSVLRNLLGNAVKFSKPGGEIVVYVARQPGQWEFQVRDRGIGMSPTVRELLLKIDARKQRAGTAGEQGSGFGLLLCDDFIQRHGGRLSVQTAEGEGTTVSFTVPELLG